MCRRNWFTLAWKTFIILGALFLAACPPPTLGPQVATPVLRPSGGTYPAGTQVSITCDTAGAALHYTTDGSLPTASSRGYAVPIVLPGSGTLTIKAIAAKAGMDDSEIASGTYTIGAPAGKAAQWARTLVTAPNGSGFRDVAVDAAGNSYCVGSIGYSALSFDFGNGVTAKGVNDTSLASPTSLLIVKYDPSGTPLWARTVGSSSTGASGYASVAVDASGNE